jgi:hypothetical protein
MANTYLTKTLGTPTLATKNTTSIWFKRCQMGSQDTLVFGNSNGGGIYIHSDDSLRYYVNSSEVITNVLLRDPSAWYHVVLSTDTTQSTASERTKLYLNGVQVTDNYSASYPSQNASSGLGSNTQHDIGRNNSGSNFFNGIISHFHMIDGTAYDASAFGETDATTGEWKIKTSPSVTYGNNGFFILKDTNSGTDQSGNGNNFTVSGNLTKTEDNPSNVFATWNPLDGNLGNSTFTYGNNKFNSEDGANKCWARSTLGMTSGKYYFEMKVQTPSNNCAIGISDRGSPNLTTELGQGAYDYSYQSSNGLLFNNSTQSSSYGNSYTTNDIVMCALDLDNNKLYFGKNGTWQNSGDPTSGSTGTGAAYTITAPSSTDGGAYFFCGGDLTGTNNVRLLANFGNGIFADNDPVASAGTNASGIGIFEYDVPTGFTALSTKGLNL